ENRPSDSAGKIRVLPESLTGSNPSRRIGHVVVKMREHGAASHVITKLDDQMWLLNLRGEDIACNPVAYSYTIINGRDVSVYLKKASAMTSVCDSLRHSGITVKDYDDFYDDLEKMNLEAPVLLDSNNINYRAYQILWKKGRIIDKINPTEEMKAVKNATEIAHIKDVYLYDSAILTRFLFFMKKNAVRQKITEFEAAELLDGMRAQLDGFRGLSFPTISAWKGNAAMMHYEATLYDNAVIDGDGLYLVDSGGQYDGGTTDVTRTLVLGKVSDEIRLHFTRTVMAMLRLQNTIFLKGCTGLNLDIIARQPMWEMGMDYKCGTGHGIGYMLNVHEGPHNIRWAHRGERPETPIVPGMIVSDEPGVYVEGSHGIRIENIELCREITENDDGTFLGFEPLTLVPIDLDGIIPEEMQPRDIELLNNYHALVRKKLMPFMQGEDIAMLNEATKAIG
ncbi:MAG: M24 family metallopeptidase, partial [Lachnospiraceae bacterium]